LRAQAGRLPGALALHADHRADRLIGRLASKLAALRLGRAAHAEVFVPRHVELLGAGPRYELSGLAVRYTDSGF
jgi:hypothetical protein